MNVLPKHLIRREAAAQDKERRQIAGSKSCLGAFGEAERNGCPCSAPSFQGGHLGAAVARKAVKVAANSRQTEVSSSMSAFNYPEGIWRICTELFNYVILSTVQ